MNLQGKIVKVDLGLSEDLILRNNHQTTAPGVVVTDWSPDNDDVKLKALNIKVLLDGNESRWLTSVPHKSMTAGSSESWEFYEDEKVESVATPDNLGKVGRDKVTGFQGIIVGEVRYLFGCNQYALRPKVDPEKMEMKDSQWFDIGRIEIVGPGISPESVQGEEPGAEFNRECPR